MTAADLNHLKFPECPFLSLPSCQSLVNKVCRAEPRPLCGPQAAVWPPGRWVPSRPGREGLERELFVLRGHESLSRALQHFKPGRGIQVTLHFALRPRSSETCCCLCCSGNQIHSSHHFLRPQVEAKDLKRSIQASSVKATMMTMSNLPSKQFCSGFGKGMKTKTY